MDSKSAYPWSHPISLHEAKLSPSVSNEVSQCFQRAIKYIIREDSQFPSLPVRLEFGYSLDEMALEMYRRLITGV